jgi:hypothetical protein
VKKIEFKNKLKNFNNIGQLCFNLGTFFLASSLFIGALFYLISLGISVFKIRLSILKEKWSLSLFLITGLLIFNTLRFNLTDLEANLESYEKSSSWYALFNWIPFFFIFIFSQEYLRSRKQRSTFTKFIVSGTIPVFISCGMQHWFNLYGPWKIFGGLIIWYNKSPDIIGNQISGLFSNANYTGFWLSATFPLIIALFTNLKELSFRKIILFLISFFSVYFIFLTGSRNALINLLVSFILIYGIKTFIIISLLALLLILFLDTTNFLSLLPESLLDFVKGFSLNEFIFKINKNITNLIKFPRVNIWLNSLLLIFQKPIFGFGAATFPSYFILKNFAIQHTHSLPLQIAFDYGIVISFFLISFPIIILFKGLKIVYKSSEESEKDLINKCWVISLLIIIIHHIFDITYFDGKISIFIWLILTGVKCIIDEEKIIN